MESKSKNGEKDPPQLLDLISRDREWLVGREAHRSSDDSKIELSLGLPGNQAWSFEKTNNLKCFINGVQEVVNGFAWHNQKHQQQQQILKTGSCSFLELPTMTATIQQQNLSVITNESSQHCCAKVPKDLHHQGTENKVCLASPPAVAALPNSSQKRTAPGPVVGWPPVRSFRKNLSSGGSQSKLSQNGNTEKKIATEKPVETCKKGMFVKINMDGVPIGRKVDLTACDSYEKLSSTVDELFRGLLTAQREASACGSMIKQEQKKAITGVLDGRGEFTLVYEDNEGDRMLVGDVPWNMFVSTVRRLRVLKSSDVSALTVGASKQEKVSLK